MNRCLMIQLMIIKSNIINRYWPYEREIAFHLFGKGFNTSMRKSRKCYTVDIQEIISNVTERWIYSTHVRCGVISCTCVWCLSFRNVRVVFLRDIRSIRVSTLSNWKRREIRSIRVSTLSNWKRREIFSRFALEHHVRWLEFLYCQSAASWNTVRHDWSSQRKRWDERKTRSEDRRNSNPWCRYQHSWFHHYHFLQS